MVEMITAHHTLCHDFCAGLFPRNAKIVLDDFWGDDDWVSYACHSNIMMEAKGTRHQRHGH